MDQLFLGKSYLAYKVFGYVLLIIISPEVITEYLISLFSGSIFGATVYYAYQFKKKLKRSATFRHRMQPSVMVLQNSNTQVTQIKTHPSARQKDEELKKELESMYDVLPPEVTNPVVKEPKFVFLLYHNII